MKRLFLIMLTLCVVVSCEKKISLVEYEHLNAKYKELHLYVYNLENHCDDLKTKIEELKSEKREREYKVERIEDKFEDAIKVAEQCEEYFDDVNDGNKAFEYDTAVRMIEQVLSVCRECLNQPF